jgi:hypothetical protein
MGCTVLFHCTCLSGLIISAYIAESPQKAAPAAAPNSGVMLGILEDIPAEYGEPDQRAIRAVFEKQGDEWIAFPAQAQSYQDLQAFPASYPKQVTWTIAFDGRSLGTVTAETPPVFQSKSQVGVQEIISDDPVPVVGEKSQDYSGFRITPVYRPLVALSQPNFNDPEAWKPAEPSPALATAARQLFRNRFPKVSNCDGSGGKPKPWPYSDAEIKVIKSFASNKQASLIELILTGWACDTIPDYGGPFDNQWYASNAQGNLSFLGSDMNFLGAADYDNNGSSEFLFSIDGRNLAGYRLYYRNFTMSAEFIFYYQ